MGNTDANKKTDAVQQNQEIRALHIRKLNVGFIAALAVFALVLFAVTLFLSAEYREVTKISDNYHRIEHDAKMVRTASDDLTSDVELFVVTGKRLYLENYFTEVHETRRRESAIEDLKQVHVTDSLLQYLEDAVEESRDLMRLEYEAMRYAAEGFGIALSELPQEIQDTALPPKAASMTAEEKIARAQELV